MNEREKGNGWLTAYVYFFDYPVFTFWVGWRITIFSQSDSFNDKFLMANGDFIRVKGFVLVGVLECIVLNDGPSWFLDLMLAFAIVN